MTGAVPLRSAGALVLVAAALSLVLVPGIPTYDPFAWIIWGREITEGDLVTSLGPSWKPLPVAFTTLFALFGDAAPWLWLWVARAGAIAALIPLWALVRRLGGGTVGAIAACSAVVFAPWWLWGAMLGNSEGLMVFFVLASIERILAGQHRAALLLGCGAALLRPESWPFLGLYALWLLWRRRERPEIVIGAGAFVLACWILPEWWGSGDPWRAANRARTDIGPRAPTNADSPVLAVVGDAVEMLTIPALVALAAFAWYAARERDRALGALVAVAAGWLLIVGLMTSGGFSGNQRYLIVPVVLLIVLAAVGAGRALGSLPLNPRLVATGTALAFTLPLVGSAQKTWERAAYEERLTRALPGVVERAGGAAAVRACGPVSTGRYLVPQVAWALHLHQPEVSQTARTPGTVFAVRTTATSHWGPPRGVISPRPVAVAPGWRVYQRCAEAGR